MAPGKSLRSHALFFQASVVKIAAEVLGSPPVDENGQTRVGGLGLAFDSDERLIEMYTAGNGVTIRTERKGQQE